MTSKNETPVFTPEQSDAFSVVNRTADALDGGAIYNAFALAIAEVGPLPGILTGGKDASPVYRMTLDHMTKAGLSPANIRRQFQRAREITGRAADAARAAYAGSTTDGKPSLARAYVALADHFKGLGVHNQYRLDVWANIVKDTEKKALTKVEKAKAALEKAEKAEATEREAAEAKSPPRLAEQIVLTIGRDIFSADDLDNIFAALRDAKARMKAKAKAEADAAPVAVAA
jgi:hypothetical protein